MALSEKKDPEKYTNYDEDISEIISGMMCIRMANRPNRDAVLILDFLANTHYKKSTEAVKYHVGSAAEGTAIFGSDVDYLYLWKDIDICQSNQKSNKHDAFLMDRTDCQSGYTKLKLKKINSGKALIFLDNHLQHWECNAREYTEMDLYLSTNKFIDIAIEMLCEISAFPNFTRQGPCATINNHDFKDMPIKGIDFAQGIKLRNLTKEAKCWLNLMNAKQIGKIWPSADTIKNIKALKCEVVAVGFRDDRIIDSPFKWRISYALWERELMWSFHSVQIHCYVILKYLIRVKLMNIFDDVSSYHLKNIVFWETVFSSYKMLQNRQLLSWVKKCLIRLRKAISEKQLNHFIHRDRNLFLSKLNNEKARLEMIAWLDKLILSTPRNNVLLTLTMKFFGDCSLETLFDNYGSRPYEFLLKAVEARFVRAGCIKRIVNCLQHGFNVSRIKLFVYCMKDKHLISFWIKKFKDMENLGVHKSFVKSARNAILSRNWLITAAKHANMGTPNEYYTDALSDRLYFCTYLIRYGRFEDAAGVISDFLETCPKLLLYCGVYQGSDTYNGINVEKGQANYVMIESSSLDVSKDPFPFILDVIANPLEISIFPPIIQIQSAVENRFIALSPIVYMYYLKVVCDIRQSRNADYSLQRLSDTVNQYILKINEFRPLNMLGHAYLLAKRYEDAYRCFLESIRNTTNDPNSVFYLLLILVYHVRQLA